MAQHAKKGMWFFKKSLWSKPLQFRIEYENHANNILLVIWLYHYTSRECQGMIASGLYEMCCWPIQQSNLDPRTIGQQNFDSTIKILGPFESHLPQKYWLSIANFVLFKIKNSHVFKKVQTKEGKKYACQDILINKRNTSIIILVGFYPLKFCYL